MSKNNEKKKYRHGIEVKSAVKAKIKKEDLLKRIEIIEEKIKLHLSTPTDEQPS